MPIVKGCIKMGIISTDTLERSDTRSVEMLIIQMAKKGNTAKQKAPCNQNYRRLAGTWQNSAISSPESVRVTRLLTGARAPRAEQCPGRGRSGLGPCPPWAGDRAVTGRVLGGASRLCLSDLLHSSTRSSSFHLFIVLVCTTGEMLQSLSLIPHYKDVDNKSPVSERLPGVCLCWTSLFKNMPQVETPS